MTPTTPPAIPSDIRSEAIEVLARMNMWDNPTRDIEEVARALLAAQERGKLMERERCAADLEIIAGKLVQRANDAFNGRDQGSAIILKSQADALIEGAAAIREAN